MFEVNQREFYSIWRKRNKVKLEEVANYIGCSLSLISKWELGHCNMSKKKLDKYNQFIIEYRK